MCQINLLLLVHIWDFYLKNWIFEMIWKIECYIFVWTREDLLYIYEGLRAASWQSNIWAKMSEDQIHMCQINLLHLVHIRAFFLKNWIFEMILKIWCFVNYLVFFMILDTKRHVLPLGNNITNHHLNGVWFFTKRHFWLWAET